MQTAIITNPIKVTNRLDEMGLASTKVRSVVEAMVTARNSSTDNDPLGAGGLFSWIMGTRRLREEFVQVGWTKEDHYQVPTIVNREVGVRIAVLNADDGAGIEDRIPQPRSRKGAATDRAASLNQRVFSDILENTLTFNPDTEDKSDGIVQWYLCVYANGETVRAELSCPVQCANGQFSAFRERIFIDLEDDGDQPLRKIGPDTDPDFDIPVFRKKAS